MGALSPSARRKCCRHPPGRAPRAAFFIEEGYVDDSRKPKVYEYDKTAVRDKLVRAFRTSARESTKADLAGLTGLPLYQIEAELPAVGDEYGASLKVTQSGEILYSFPGGMRSRYRGFRPWLARTWRAFRKGAVAVAKTVFKAWIVIMLLGYFILFLALALFAMVASVAVQQGGGGGNKREDRGRGGGIGGLWLTGRLFDSLIRLWFYSELLRDPDTRRRQTLDRENRKPLYKAVFSHVFGDGDPNPGWADIEKKSVVAFLQTHKGIITMPEFMAVTGLGPEQAETAINRYMLEFEGSPEVTEGGTIYFSFPKLLARTGVTPEAYGSTVALKRLGKFSSNTKKMDNVFRFVNIFNLAFGGYYLYNAVTVGGRFLVNTSRGLALRGGFPYLYSASAWLFSGFGAANPANLLFWALGITPLVFSALFFGIPIIRNARLRKQNEDIKVGNLRKAVYRSIIDTREVFSPASFNPPVEEARPADPNAAERIARKLAAWSSSEPVSGGYYFKDIISSQEEAAKLRSSIDLARFKPGDTVFDTDS